MCLNVKYIKVQREEALAHIIIEDTVTTDENVNWKLFFCKKSTIKSSIM